MTNARSLASYRLLGRSGLRVSPFALGTMTFGLDWSWGSDPAESRRVFDAYVERGGNFIDTASNYTNGTAEALVGEFAEGRRDDLVIATKYSLNRRAGDPNAGGNHRKNMVHSVETSLRRLRSDYIDLLYLHVWDGTTPVEEILRALDDLVRAGKVLYAGISDTPAWQVSRMQAIADLRGWTPFVALQIEHSLIERTVERELVPMARELGLGVGPHAHGVSHDDTAGLHLLQPVLYRAARHPQLLRERRHGRAGIGTQNAKDFAVGVVESVHGVPGLGQSVAPDCAQAVNAAQAGGRTKREARPRPWHRSLPPPRSTGAPGPPASESPSLAGGR